MDVEALIDYISGTFVTVTGQDAGQCTAVAHYFERMLKLPIVYGDAKDTLANADPQYYTIVNYTPGLAAPANGVIVFDQTWGNGAGHTGVVRAGTSSNFVALEQNNPLGSATHLVNHNSYQGVLGWFIPKITEVQDMTVQAQDIRNLWPLIFQGSAPSQSDLDTWTGKSFQDFVYGLASSPEFQAQMADFENWKALGIKLSSTPSAQQIEQIKQIVDGE